VPELPEVETIRRQLAPRVAGRTVVEAEIFDPLWCAPRAPADVEADLRGELITSIGRRGKYLILAFESERFCVMHLRMTGNLLWVAEQDDVQGRPYLRVRLVLDDGNRLLFVDLRRFGTGVVIDGRERLGDYLGARVGPEPLEPDFTREVLASAARGRKAPVKAFLLDQRRIAGVGNIYADEALFRARLHPLRPAGKLGRAEIERLHTGIIEALEAGIARQGASIDRYRDANGARGSMQDEFLVYSREGEPCVRCGRPIVKTVTAGRGTYVCRHCQPAPRARRVATP
jgi:formamidopyrimidine-DNA glycosylase